MFYTHITKCPPHLNKVLTLPSENEMNHHFLYFYNALLEYYQLHQAE